LKSGFTDNTVFESELVSDDNGFGRFSAPLYGLSQRGKIGHEKAAHGFSEILAGKLRNLAGAVSV